MLAALTSVCCQWQVGCLVLAICTMGVIQVVGIKTCRFHSGPCVCVVDSKQKLPQFAAVYNLATHQSVRMLTKKPLQTNLTMSYLVQARDRARDREREKGIERKRMTCAAEHFRFRLRFCVCTLASQQTRRRRSTIVASG